MYSKQSSSEQFMLYLKSLGGSEADVAGPACAVSDEDTAETVISRLRMEKYARGSTHVEPSILQAAAQVLVSRRDERDHVHPSEHLQGGGYQLDIQLSGSDITRETIPGTSLKEAKIWARERLDALGAHAGVIYFSTLAGTRPGTGTRASNFERSVGWLVPMDTPPAAIE